MLHSTHYFIKSRFVPIPANTHSRYMLPSQSKISTRKRSQFFKEKLVKSINNGEINDSQNLKLQIIILVRLLEKAKNPDYEKDGFSAIY